MTSPLIQVVDENDNFIKGMSMHDAHNEGLLHRLSRVILEDENGKVLLQKRVINTSVYPGRWDTSAAGHVDVGETYLEAAKRELGEEIGIEGIELHEIGHYKISVVFNNRKLSHFTKVYRSVIKSDANLILEASEVSSVKWFSVDEIKELVKTSPELFTEGVDEIMNRYY